MVRTGYIGVGIGAVLLVVLAATGAGIILGILGAIILVALGPGHATRAMRSL